MPTPAELRSLLDRYDAAVQRKAARYRADPVAWTHDHIRFPEGQGPTEYQDEILARLASSRRVAVRAPRGGGKTAPAAWATLWWSLTHQDDWKALTTAGSWLQLSQFLWPEIHKWSRLLDWDRLGRPPFNLRDELLTLRLSLAGGEAFAINSDRPDLLEGAHARNLLAVVDEGKSVPDASWDAIEGYFSNPGEHAALALSVPGAPAGRFYDICSRRPGFEEWDTLHVTIDRAITAGRVSSSWVEQRRRQWGEDSPLFRNHVLAEFGGESDGVIPLAWVEAAVERWTGQGQLDRLAVDVADEGGDDTVMALRSGDEITGLRRYPTGDTMMTAERAANLDPPQVTVDSIGVGAGVLSRLRQLLGDQRVSGFVASEGTDRRDKSGEMRFANKRAAAWWNLRELLEPPSTVALPDDALLLGDLTAPRWREITGGRIGIESKDDLRKRLGRSTDAGDAVVMAFWEDHSRLGFMMV